MPTSGRTGFPADIEEHHQVRQEVGNASGCQADEPATDSQDNEQLGIVGGKNPQKPPPEIGCSGAGSAVRGLPGEGQAQQKPAENEENIHAGETESQRKLQALPISGTARSSRMPGCSTS